MLSRKLNSKQILSKCHPDNILKIIFLSFPQIRPGDRLTLALDKWWAAEHKVPTELYKNDTGFPKKDTRFSNLKYS